MYQKFIAQQDKCEPRTFSIQDPVILCAFHELLKEYLGLSEGLVEMNGKITLLNVARFRDLANSRQEWAPVLTSVLKEIIENGGILFLEQDLSLLYGGATALVLIPREMLSGLS